MLTVPLAPGGAQSKPQASFLTGKSAKTANVSDPTHDMW